MTFYHSSHPIHSCVEETKWWQSMARKSKDYLLWTQHNNYEQVYQATSLFHYALYNSEVSLNKVFYCCN
jgi:hypothetical protein